VLLREGLDLSSTGALRRMASVHGLLHDDALTINGRTIGENNRDAQCWKPDVVRTFDEPFKRDAGIAVLRGNLAPDGAIIKPSAASKHLMQHTGRAVVFESVEDLHARINDDAVLKMTPRQKSA